MPDFDFNNEMCKSSELTESECFQIIGFHNAGFSRNDINKTLGFAKTTITRTIQNYCDERRGFAAGMQERNPILCKYFMRVRSET